MNRSWNHTYSTLRQIVRRSDSLCLFGAALPAMTITGVKPEPQFGGIIANITPWVEDFSFTVTHLTLNS